MRLVLAYPQELDQGEIGESGITGQLQKPPRANRLIEPRTLFLSPLIAPYDRWPQNSPILIENHGPVHLAG
jgi:hypothetical protein